MQIPDIGESETPSEYSGRLADWYAANFDLNLRKTRGQIFTPTQIGKFMSGLLEVKDGIIRLLDPGAGTGVLTASFCEQLFSTEQQFTVDIDLYENNPELAEILKRVLDVCKVKAEEVGIKLNYNIYQKDFILHNAIYFSQSSLLNFEKNRKLYDYVISNPPYYKINKDDPHSKIMAKLVSGQPNIYTLFMALSASMLKKGGEMVFITPRSFCSGLYYKKFRNWFLENSRIMHIHIFESRKEVFTNDAILQENIILKAEKVDKEARETRIMISTSRNKNVEECHKFWVDPKSIIYRKNGDVFIRIPTSPLDVEVLRVVDSWPNLLDDMQLKISTGPVIPFRAKDFLLPRFEDDGDCYPLLWMHNMKNMRVVWPLRKNNKASAIRLSKKSSSLMLPVKNYVLLNRFSSKEQMRRLHSAVLLKSQFSFEKVGIENHMNYIYRPNGSLSGDEAIGIAAILSTSVVDNFFRSLNGSTQVNATDIQSLPFPSLEKIKRIGKYINEHHYFNNGLELDRLVAAILGIQSDVIERLNRGDEHNDQDR